MILFVIIIETPDPLPSTPYDLGFSRLYSYRILCSGLFSSSYKRYHRSSTLVVSGLLSLCYTSGQINYFIIIHIYGRGYFSWKVCILIIWSICKKAALQKGCMQFGCMWIGCMQIACIYKNGCSRYTVCSEMHRRCAREVRGGGTPGIFFGKPVKPQTTNYVFKFSGPQAARAP